jgi:hypothetical protein
MYVYITMNSKYILLVVLLLAVTAVQMNSQAVYATSHYQIGYNDGCAGNVVPGKHTSEYLTGYSDGSRACRVYSPGVTLNPQTSNANSNANNNDNSARQTVIINGVPVK